MSIVFMLLFMISPLFIPVVGELAGRVNDKYAGADRRRSRSGHAQP